MSPGPTVAYSPHRLSQEVGGAPSGVGAALAQPGQQHVAGAGGDGQQWVIAPGAGVAVVARALLGQTVGLADGGIEVDGERCVAESGTGLPDPGQQLAAHPVQLADVAPAKAAQEGAQGGGGLDHTAQGAGCPAGAQRIGVVDAVAARQRRGDQRHYLVAGVGSAWGPAQVQVPVNQLGQAKAQGEGGGKNQTGKEGSTLKQEVQMEGEARFVGIDVSKAQVDVAVRPTGKRWTLPYDQTGIEGLIPQIVDLEPALVLLEATGGLELPLVAALAAAALPVVVVSQVRDFAKATGTLAKTDTLDAGVLAHFADAVRPEVRPLKDAETQVLNSVPAGTR